MTPTPIQDRLAELGKRATNGLGAAPVLDRLAQPVADGVGQALDGHDSTRGLLGGRWLGHALHPLLVAVPIGAWTSALVLEATRGEDAGSTVDALLALGVATAVPSAAAGLSDWQERAGDESVRRIGIAHAAANVTGTVCFGLAALASRGGALRRGSMLLGLATVGVGGYLGGHLAYVEGAQVQSAPLGEPAPL